uniref:Uncharacterized protein n=1 Tax=Anguilla anguilla TaxID=7936 RepID=A0A0E9X2E3_ANGAN
MLNCCHANKNHSFKTAERLMQVMQLLTTSVLNSKWPTVPHHLSDSSQARAVTPSTQRSQFHLNMQPKKRKENYK